MRRKVGRPRRAYLRTRTLGIAVTTSRESEGVKKKPDQQAIVARAAYFFRKYANEKPTTYFNGPFSKFCRSFYGIVTGARLGPSGLEKAIKAEVKTPTIGT